MFFVNTRKKLTSNTFLLHLLPAGTVLVTVLGLTLLGWRNAREAYNVERQNSINQLVENTKGNIQEKLGTYELMLKGASGLFISSSQVSRTEWSNFVENFDAEKNYPGIQGIGFARHAFDSEVPELIQMAQQNGVQDLVIFPEGDRSEYVVNMYFAPNHSQGIGYDMFSEPTRKQAIEHAKSAGGASISGKLEFAITSGGLSNTGFSMYYPVYANETQQELSPEDREVTGYVFAPFAVDIFFNRALSEEVRNTHAIRIYDAEISNENLLFESSSFASHDNNGSLEYSTPIELYGRKWVLDFRIDPDIIAQTTRNRPMSSLVVGVMLSFLLSGFVLTLLVARTRVLSHAKQLEVQSAKDELLSLASHQLRTPATSVKQYLGMALEGFAGKLSSQQKKLLDKAYESNERQLHIINEILYVAKIDAQGIVLTPRRVNFNKLLKDLAQELTATAKKNNQKIRLQVPMKTVYAEADEYCIRMVLENLISNALKYSHEGTTTNIKLSTSKDSIKVVVRDKGVGIDADDISMLFQRFSRIPNELTKQTSGSGIGLYLSLQLVKLHSGSIDVESEKGKGTIFTMELPKKYKEGQFDARQDGV